MTDKAHKGTEAPPTCCTCALSALLSIAAHGVDPKDVSLQYHQSLKDLTSSDMAAMLLSFAAHFFAVCICQVGAEICDVNQCPLLCLVHSCCHLVLYCPQELSTLLGHIKALIHAGNEQTNSFSSTMDWERLRGEAAITYDKAMQSMVTAALPLCNKGTHTWLFTS